MNIASIAALVLGTSGSPVSPVPSIAYEIRVDSAHTDAIDVIMHLRHAPRRVLLAMKVHPEYDARFWRYLELTSGNVVRVDTTLWLASLPGGNGDIRYTIHLPRPSGENRRAWQCVVRADGALINLPDVLLYLPQFTDAPATIHIRAPASWRAATALDTTTTTQTLSAPNAATMLDSPILLGRLREWAFADAGTRFIVAYWPLPNATPFDTSAFVSNLRALAHAALGVFGSAPSPSYWFLVQDGADDALEHRASLTIGVPSADLARNPRAHITEIAHEFFHTWNLVAIHPDSFGDLTYRRTPPTGGLWLGEGVTLHYADVLTRRAHLADTTSSRAAHLEDLLSRYYAVPWARSVSPEAASRAFGRSPLTNPNATGGYYLQGELLGEALDAALRDSTRNRRSLDDVMWAMYDDSRRRGGRGVTSQDVERVADSVCECRLAAFFDNEVRAPGLIDLAPAMARLGWRIEVDTAPATDTRGTSLADLRVNGAPIDDSTLALVITYPASLWARAGLRTGDAVDRINGSRPSSFGQLYGALRRLRIGDSASLDIRREGAPMHFDVVTQGYTRPRVRLVEAAVVTPEQRERRARWMEGW